MPFGIAVLIGFQLVGEIVRQTFGLPLPGPLIGMVLLAIALTVRERGRGAEADIVATSSSPLVQASTGLITSMGLLFVPAGVGVVAEMGLLRAQWLPILVGLVVSTLLGLAVTGLVMHHVSRVVDARTPAVPSPAARPQEVL